MPYITTYPESDPGPVAPLYEMIRAKRGRVANIWQIFSLRPALLQTFLPWAMNVTFGGSTLGRRREELISVHVSNLTSCEY